MQTMTQHWQPTLRTASLHRALERMTRPLHSEDPLVRLYTLFGLGLMAAGLLAPHGTAWGALGCALLGFCYAWERA